MIKLITSCYRISMISWPCILYFCFLVKIFRNEKRPFLFFANSFPCQSWRIVGNIKVCYFFQQLSQSSSVGETQSREQDLSNRKAICISGFLGRLGMSNTKKVKQNPVQCKAQWHVFSCDMRIYPRADDLTKHERDLTFMKLDQEGQYTKLYHRS